MARRGKKIAGAVCVEFQFPTPNPKQREFLLARHKYIAYGGARAGGKSWAVRMKALLGALTYPGIRILIMRRTYPELEATMIEPLLALIYGATTDKKPAGRYVADYNATLRTIFFTNGSVVKFGHLQNQASLTEYQGQEFDWIFIDEATHFTEYEFRTLGACLRGVNQLPKRMYLTCNPGGVGHQWVKRLFVARQYEVGKEHPDDYRFIPATVDDNTVLSDDARSDYIASLDLLPEDMRAAHRYGDWDALAGQYFSEFKRERHVVKPFSLPPAWPRYRVFDYGLDMFACYWAAIDFDGRIWVYREYCESGLIVSDAAAAMCRLTPAGERIAYTVAPPDMWTTLKDTGRTIAEIFARDGIALVRAGNARVQGWLIVKEYLKIRADGKPGLLVFEDCVSLIRSLPALRHSEHNPSDADTQPHDMTHSPDALRYLCTYRAMSAQKGEALRRYDDDEDGEDYDDAMRGGALSGSYLTYS